MPHLLQKYFTFLEMSFLNAKKLGKEDGASACVTSMLAMLFKFLKIKEANRVLKIAKMELKTSPLW